MKIPFTNYEISKHQEPEERYIEPPTGDTPDIKVRMPQWMYKPHYGVARTTKIGEVFNSNEMRLLGSSASVWQCKKRIGDAIVSCPWKILPVDPDHPNKQKMKEIDSFLRYHPNENQESFNNIMFSTVMDILDLDAGVIIKVFGKYARNKLLQLYSRDGALIYKEIDAYGRIKQYYQYDWSGMEAIKLQKKEVAYIMMNSRSDSPYGEPPLESIKLVIRGLVKGVETHELIQRKGGIPSGILSLEGMNKEDFNRFKRWWKKKISTNVYQRTMINVPTKWTPLITNFKDLEFLENQKWFTELVYRTFKVPHYGLGIASRTVKGALQEERATFMKETIKPYLQAIEQVMNQQILPWLYPKGVAPDCYFHYTIIDHMEEAEKLELWIKRFEWGMHNVNEYRKETGLIPLPWGNINPMFLKDPLSFSQARWYGVFDNEAYQSMIGIETGIEHISRIAPTKVSPSQETEERAYAYETLPEACVCRKCGYVLENPTTHCRDIKCPKCGARMWRK